ncbi:MAG TPA: hypothetical protein VGV85_13645, partial [Longimicrobiaceae bacterium]|nr:hypothetical protein [Longimicrobiaceae bacterium]
NRNIEALGIKNETVKSVMRTSSAITATVTATAFEVVADTVMIGPNILAGLDSAGANIGVGAARIAEADNSTEAWLGVAQLSGGIGEGALVAVGVLSMGQGAAIRNGPNITPGMSRGQRLRENKLAGDRFEGQVLDDSTSVLTETAEQVSIEPYTAAPTAAVPSPPTAGYTVRVDLVQKSRVTGGVYLKEAKSSATAGLTRNQDAGYPLIEQFGGVVRGANGGTVLPQGTVVTPRSVGIIRPANLQAKMAVQGATAAAADANYQKQQ